MNTPFGNSITTAEHAIALMMALARELPAANASTQAGKWEKNRFMGVELYGKTLGLIGAGNIGSIVADRAKGLKMKVDRLRSLSLSPERAQRHGRRESRAERSSRARGFHHACTRPLTNETRNIISADAINKMKKGARIINCARGGLVDETALKAALDQRPPRRRGARRVRGRTRQVEHPLRQRQGRGDAASGRLHQRGAGERGAAGCRTDLRLSFDGRHHQRAQHAVHQRRRSRRRCGPGSRWPKSSAPLPDS